MLTTAAYCPSNTAGHCHTAEGLGRAIVSAEERSHATALSSL
jgi:hypothetical protein